MKKVLVLTSTLGDMDLLTDPTYTFDSCDYIAIVDKKHNTNVWQQFDYYNFSSIDQHTNRRNAKVYKALSTILFPNYDYIVWHDANFEIMIDPIDIIKEYGDHDFYTLQHPIRDCSYEEMRIIQSSNRDNPNIIENQFNYYNSQGFPKNYGLYAMGNTIRKVNWKITTLELKWWEHIIKYSSRDQCSFMYCLWHMQKTKVNIDIQILNGRLENNKYFRNKGTRLK